MHYLYYPVWNLGRTTAVHGLASLTYDGVPALQHQLSEWVARSTGQKQRSYFKWLGTWVISYLCPMRPVMWCTLGYFQHLIRNFSFNLECQVFYLCICPWIARYRILTFFHPVFANITFCYFFFHQSCKISTSRVKLRRITDQLKNLFTIHAVLLDPSFE